MVAPSKLYKEPLCRLYCSTVIHPGKSCLNFALGDLQGFVLSISKYYLPLLVSPLFTKWSTLNRKLVLKSLKFYIQVIGCSLAIGLCTLSQVCFLRHLLGSFHKYTLVGLPGLIGSLTCWFAPQRVLNLFVIATSQTTIEIMLRHRWNLLTCSICDSKLVRTALFMVNSAIVLHCKRANVYNGFWFLKPIETEVTKANNLKSQQNNNEATEKVYFGQCAPSVQECWSFCWSGLKSYLLLGISVDLFSILRRSKTPSGTHGFLNIILSKFRQLDVRKLTMTSFFLFYVGIYRLSHWLLQQFYTSKSMDNNGQQHWPHLASAFLGGAAFIFIDQLTIYTFSLVLTIKALWEWFSRHSHGNTVFFSKLKRIEFSKILISCNLFYMLNIFAYKNHLLNNLSRGFINALTNNCAQNAFKYVTENDMETMLRNNAAKRPYR